MGYGTDGLTFNTLRSGNIDRQEDVPSWAQNTWRLSAWSNACLGELGEAANIIKKIERGDFTLEEARPALAKEFADVVTYLDILAARAGVNLGEATIAKFNEVSKRVGSKIRIDADGSHRRDE